MSGIESLYALAEVVAGKPSPMMLFPVGDWRSEKYPKLSLPQELADAVIANFDADVMHRRVPVESVGSHDATSPAGGWLDRVYMAPFEWQGLSGEALYADWTPNERGAQIVNDGEYAYNSVELDSFIDPMTGDKSVNVLKAVALTNRPVLSFMPPVRDAGDSIKLAEPVEIALAEITLAAIPEFIKKSMRAKWRKQNPGKDDAEMPDNMKEDPDATKASVDASSEPASHDAKGDEGHNVALADGDADKKGGPIVDLKTLETLKLSEGADESAVSAAVMALSEDRDTQKGRAEAAEAKLAEEAKRIRSEAVERTLGELIEGGHITPGQKGEMLLLAEDSPAGFDRAAEILKTSQAIVLGEVGTSQSGADEKPADVQLAERAKALHAAGKAASIALAQGMVLAEDPALAERIRTARYGKGA